MTYKRRPGYERRLMCYLIDCLAGNSVRAGDRDFDNFRAPAGPDGAGWASDGERGKRPGKVGS